MLVSRSPQPRLIASVDISSTISATGIGTSNSRASSTASVRSLCASDRAKLGGSNSPRNDGPRQSFVEDGHPADRTATDALPQQPRVHAGLDSERHALGDGLPDRLRDHVVDELGDAAGADGADVEDVVAEGLQNGPDPLEHLAVTARHDRQRAGRRAPLAPAHRVRR